VKLGWIALLEHRRLADARRWVASLLRLLDERRSPDARFWLQLSVGAATLLVAAYIFGKVAEDVVTREPGGVHGGR